MMGIGLGAAPACAVFGFLAFAPAVPPSFTDAWYREVVLGEVAAAGELYQRIYEDSGASPSRSAIPLEIRRKAALRAGGCFERLGDASRAREAYAWILRSLPPQDPAAPIARLRILGIPPAAAPSPPSPPEKNAALERLRSRIERREVAVGELGAEIRRLAATVRGEERVRRRLEDLGIELRFAGGPDDRAKVTPTDMAQLLDAADREPLREELHDRYYLRGLRKLRDRDPAAAAEAFRKAVAFGGERRRGDAADLLQVAEGILKPMEGVSQLAAARLLERRFAREWEARQSLRSSLEDLDRLVDLGQGPTVRAELERVRSGEEWAPPGLRMDSGVRALVREADEKILADILAGPGGPWGQQVFQKYEDLRVRGRRAAEGILSAAEDLMDLRWNSLEKLRPALPAETGAGARGILQETIGDEVERLFVRGDDLFRRDPLDQSPEGWRQEFLDLQILLQWFPEADPDQRIRRLAQEYLGR